MFMCVVNQKSVNKLDLTWKQSFLIVSILMTFFDRHFLNDILQRAFFSRHNFDNIFCVLVWVMYLCVRVFEKRVCVLDLDHIHFICKSEMICTSFTYLKGVESFSTFKICLSKRRSKRSGMKFRKRHISIQE
jgi:hypothetical protein